VSTVLRLGDTVVRSLPANAAFTAALLEHLERAGWTGAPRLIRRDPDKEVLTYIEGTVPWAQPVPDWALTEHSLTALARLLREFHDLTAGTSLARDAEIVCHNDLSPKNTVYREQAENQVPVAFLDWDLAAPGRRIHDVAHVCWQWLELGPGVVDLERTRHLIRVIADGYRLEDGPGGRDDLLPAVLWWQDRCWRGMEAEAAAGHPAMQRLVADGTSTAIREAYNWTASHQHLLQ